MESFPEEKVEKFGTQTPVNRAAMPKEYGPAFVFLACNEDSSMVSGEVRLDASLKTLAQVDELNCLSCIGVCDPALPQNYRSVGS